MVAHRCQSKNNKNKQKLKKCKKYSEKKPTKLSWPMSVKSDKKVFLFKKRKKKKKLPWPMSAKSDT